MFNAARVAAVVAMVALGGSLALMSSRLGPSESTVVPGAEAPSFEDVVHVTGLLYPGGPRELGESTTDGVALHERGFKGSGSVTADDPRLSGQMVLTYNSDAFGPTFTIDSGAIYAGTITIENDEGAWDGTWRGVVYPSPVEDATNQVTRHQLVLTGSGSYEGLSALIDYDHDSAAASGRIEGLIFPGEPPEYP